MLARQLGLRPKPAGRSPSAWYADCPGKSHRLMVSSSANEFGCGYCRVKGSTADLETLARQRKEAAGKVRRPPQDQQRLTRMVLGAREPGGLSDEMAEW
ncbi:hypothetical protein LG277_06480 [Vreelandella aquamarina]|uniref:hypothetical protein n=1 Tax=Vreelandella aquamarina TaxID=77097 RepID=UPI00384D1FEF